MNGDILHPSVCAQTMPEDELAEDELPEGPPCDGNWSQNPRGGEIIAALRGVYDPEIPVNLYDLGLIYRIDISENGDVEVDMTLTTPGCPVAEEMPGMVQAAISPLSWVAKVQVEIIWDPPWTMDRLSEIARIELGFF